MSEETVGNYIKFYRTNVHKMNLRQFSELTGVSFSHLSKIERGEHVPSKATLDILAEKTDLKKHRLYVLSGYASPKEFDKSQKVFETLFPTQSEEDAKRDAVIKKIATEFPDADLMFKDLASFTAEDLEEVYDYIKFKKSQKK